MEIMKYVRIHFNYERVVEEVDSMQKSIVFPGSVLLSAMCELRAEYACSVAIMGIHVAY